MDHLFLELLFVGTVILVVDKHVFEHHHLRLTKHGLLVPIGGGYTSLVQETPVGFLLSKLAFLDLLFGLGNDFVDVREQNSADLGLVVFVLFGLFRDSN